MLHAVRIKDGKAAFSNAYVQTSKLKQEKKAGRPLFLTVSRIAPAQCGAPLSDCLSCETGSGSSSTTSFRACRNAMLLCE
jgi:carotenoid cleavage dioxygenase-like enzyme